MARGPAHEPFLFFDQDGLYLPWHFNQLNSVQKHLCRVTVGRPAFKDEPKEYTTYLQGMNYLNDGTPIAYVDMENTGSSYGQLATYFSQETVDFDYTIFTEDDYIPVIDNFDLMLVDLMEKRPNCGYLCSVYGEEGHRRGAAVSTGIIRNKALKDIVSKLGSIPHKGPDVEPQQVFSDAFYQTQWSIDDYLNEYSSLFLAKDELNEDKLLVYGDANGKFIFAPIQMLNKDALRMKRCYFTNGIVVPHTG